ncbi:NADH dehydrogenase [ubiquinone] 1 alpha subcomplex assembly factor 5, partial [Cichlidogyrus casuarinus]
LSRSMECAVAVKQLEMDEEDLVFEEKSLDCVLSCLSLQWVNDLPGTFKRVLHSLKQDGCFLGALYGKDTLFEMRVSLQLAELERRGGFSPHSSPFADNVDIGNLLHEAGFSLITLDVDEIVINYPSLSEILIDLKAMGERNCTWNRPMHLWRDVLYAANAIYL